MEVTIVKPRKDEMRLFRCTLCGQTSVPLVRVTRQFNWVAFLAWLIFTAGIGAVVYMIGYGVGLCGREERKYICGNCRNAGCLVPPIAADPESMYQGPKKKCPECAELVQADAKVCRFCGHRFEPSGQTQAGP